MYNNMRLRIPVIPVQDQQKIQTNDSWTDALPVCKLSGVGSSTNQIYREDGSREEEHPFEDKSFHCIVNDSTYFYGVFDGHYGSKIATFALQRMAAEILLEELSAKSTDEEIKDVLRQAFISVEKGYLESIDSLLAEKASLLYEIPDDLSSYEVYEKYPQEVKRLHSINCELSSGTAAVVALIHNGKLYVANVGNCRALLCKTDADMVLRVVQLSIDHDLRNEDELLRLSQLGLNVDKLRRGTVVGNQENTRCLGNFLVKGGYREFDDLNSATAEPIIAEPEIHGGIAIDESCKFLLLMSDGLYKSLEEASDGKSTDEVNRDIAQLVVGQFRVQSTLTGVAQAVVDQTVRIHHDFAMSSGTIAKRDDITLLIRNFNYTLPNAVHSPANSSMKFTPGINSPITNTLTDITTNNSKSSNIDTFTSTKSDQFSDTNNSEIINNGNVFNNNRRIPAYVDFSDYYRSVAAAQQNGSLPDGIDF